MVNRVSRRKQNSVMTVFADVAGLNMRRIFANGVGAVVTAETVTSNIEVIEIRRNPAGARVAVIAGVCAGDVCRILASGNRAIVA